MDDVEGVVLTGIYGVGKSSVVAEMAYLLEQHDIGYGAIDVDWLWWFEIPDLSKEQSRNILFANLKAVVTNYMDAGASRFLLAWSIRSQEDLDTLKSIVPFPLRVIALTTSLENIKERLSADVTTERQEDIRNSEKWLKAGIDSNIHEAEVSNDRPIQEVATEILELVGWERKNTHNKKG